MPLVFLLLFTCGLNNLSLVRADPQGNFEDVNGDDLTVSLVQNSALMTHDCQNMKLTQPRSLSFVFGPSPKNICREKIGAGVFKGTYSKNK